MKKIRSILVSLGIVAVVVAATVFAFGVHVSSASAAAGGNEVFHGKVMKPRPAKGASPAVTSSNMTYHGGPVSTVPKVYISWWGSQWNTGFSTGGYSSTKAQTYITGFFGNVGGSSWHQIDTQYCKGVPVGTVNCGTSGQHITNPTGELGGTWVDTTSVPTSPTQTSIFNAAARLVTHFGFSSNAIYLVFTPTAHSMSGFGTQWCAWHDNGSSGGHNIAYGYIPYMPNAGQSCGMNFVNATNNSYGNGYFDGFSIVAGHEFMEAESDMTPSTSVAWQGPGGGSDENADKCAWNQNGGVSKNITLGSHSYAVQPIWSNNSTTSSGSHCVTSHT